MNAIEWTSLRFAWADGRPVLDLGPFALARGAEAAIVGPSGSGKTTLLSVIAGALSPAFGDLRVLGGSPSAAAGRVGWVLQGAPLIDALDVQDNVLLPLRLRSDRPMDPGAPARAGALLHELGLGGALRWRPARLSAGERQRVALARALINDPALILADEPTTGLDPTAAAGALALLRAACRRRGAALLLVTHDPAAWAGSPQQLWLGALAPETAWQGDPKDGGRGALPPATPPEAVESQDLRVNRAIAVGAWRAALPDAAWWGRAAVGAAPIRSAMLVMGVALAVALPTWSALTARVVRATALDRAAALPLLAVPRGEVVDGALAALRLRPGPAPALPAGVARQLRQGPGGANAVISAMHLRHTSDGVPIVAVEPEWFEARGLRAATGHLPGLLGEVVVGARVAAERGWGPGAMIQNDLLTLTDLAGAYPLRLPVVGVLKPTGGPEDNVLLTDLRTAWALDGHLHGHDDPARAAGSTAAAGRQGAEHVEASAALFMVQDLDAAARPGFHLHGDLGALPVSAIAVFPTDSTARDLVLGELDGIAGVAPAVPRTVVEGLLDVLEVAERGLRLGLLAVGAAAVAFAVLLVQVSLQARASERTLLRRLGASPRRVRLYVAAELVIVAIGALVLAAALVGGGLWALTLALA